ncbi:hypothetical protein ACIPRI_24760 [Variovorax sp. LARHSF232]
MTPEAQNAVLSAVAPPEMGKVSGLFNVFRYLGGAAFAAGFSAALSVGAGLSLMGALAGLCLPAMPGAPRAP